MRRYWGTVSFLDYLSLAKIGGTWKIVSKLFAHVGGEPPRDGVRATPRHRVGGQSAHAAARVDRLAGQSPRPTTACTVADLMIAEPGTAP